MKQKDGENPLDPYVTNNKPITASMMQALFDSPREYLTYDQVCDMLQIGHRTLARWVCLGKIPHMKLGKYRGAPVRFKRADIVAWLQKQWSYGK